MNERDEFYSKTEILEVFIWSCLVCGQTSLPVIFGTWPDAEKALSSHWDLAGHRMTGAPL